MLCLLWGQHGRVFGIACYVVVIVVVRACRGEACTPHRCCYRHRYPPDPDARTGDGAPAPAMTRANAVLHAGPLDSGPALASGPQSAACRASRPSDTQLSPACRRPGDEVPRATPRARTTRRTTTWTPCSSSRVSYLDLLAHRRWAPNTDAPACLGPLRPTASPAPRGAARRPSRVVCSCPIAERGPMAATWTPRSDSSQRRLVGFGARRRAPGVGSAGCPCNRHGASRELCVR